MEAKQKTRRMIMTALLAAIIAVCTRFTAFPIPGTAGYVHVGDAFIFLAAVLLPTPYAVFAGALGGALADFMYGSVVYILPTAIIKALMAFCFFGRQQEKILRTLNLLRSILAAVIMCAGYYVTEAIMYQSLVSPLIGIVWNLVQGVFSTAVFVAVAAALDAAKFRERLKK